MHVIFVSFSSSDVYQRFYSVSAVFFFPLHPFQPQISLSLTLILLTWRIWRAPNSASRWQMGFNSALKGLISPTPYGYNRLIRGFMRTVNCLLHREPASTAVSLRLPFAATTSSLPLWRGKKGKVHPCTGTEAPYRP